MHYSFWSLRRIQPFYLLLFITYQKTCNLWVDDDWNKEFYWKQGTEALSDRFRESCQNDFRNGFQNTSITPCYFNTCQTVIRKVGEISLKTVYENNNEVRGFIRCLPAFSHGLFDDEVAAFEELLKKMYDTNHMD